MNCTAMKYITKSLLLFIISVFLTVGFNHANAQSREQQFDPENVYLPVTFDNIVKLYWALGKVTKINDKRIDDYLMITECDIYKRFYDNDLEWEKIRAVTKDNILNIQNSFPTKIFIVLPIQLERYDSDEEKFAISPNTAFKKDRQLPISYGNDKRDMICDRFIGNFEDYPTDLILTLDIPIQLEKLKMDKETAARIIENKNFQDSERTLYLKLYIDLDKFKGMGVNKSNYSDFSYIGAKIDKAEIYLDSTLIRKVKDIEDITPKSKVVRESIK